mmetsp:Transcript_28630/g.45632  ORF Transcript_28630/g.45632 Transcript_28630/m.45632 type:complete len:208 (-) Transcript_28630:1454-2077(-)
MSPLTWLVARASCRIDSTSNERLWLAWRQLWVPHRRRRRRCRGTLACERCRPECHGRHPCDVARFVSFGDRVLSSLVPSRAGSHVESETHQPLHYHPSGCGCPFGSPWSPVLSCGFPPASCESPRPCAALRDPSCVPVRASWLFPPEACALFRPPWPGSLGSCWFLPLLCASYFRCGCECGPSCVHCQQSCATSPVLRASCASRRPS